MSEPVKISLECVSQGKGRAPAFVCGDRLSHYTPEKIQIYEGTIRTAAMQEMAGLQGAITALIRDTVMTPRGAR
jgi:hypothetical protein